ncbi:hypothetical protein Bca52824_063138 [Brassica carinata]|uniref:SOUL heme-binding protein n=1 Tax=Brassica carinata TaxID=52824 RepID=A0A8X7QEZ4_BRACI|nr:hypothetical protein Bca52824_063138 [Brassica carinata]
MEAAGLSFFKLSFLLSLLSGGSDLLNPISEPGLVGKFLRRVTESSAQTTRWFTRETGTRFAGTIQRSGFPLNRFKTSLKDATRTAFFQLFAYIQGKNEYHQKIEMTAPVISQVSPSDGPLCESSFTVSFYVPKNQPDPAPAENLHIQKWTPRYVAVRQFSFVSDYNVGEEAAALSASLEEDGGVGADSAYTVAQYNSPFEFIGRVNEIWLPFQMDD